MKVWYLIFAMLGQPETLIGPLDDAACHRVLDALQPVPDVIAPRCSRVVGFRTCPVDGSPGTARACPIFEGELVVPLGSR